MYRIRLFVIAIGVAVMLTPSIAMAGDFMEDTTVEAWVATSYNINFENQRGAAQQTANPYQPFHERTNSFQLDQAFLVIDKPATDDSRVGGHVAFAYGEYHDTYLQLDVLQTAFFSYRAPVMEGLVLSGGLLPTRIGAEDTTATANYNITNGIVWGIQPINNTGLIVDTWVTPELAVVVGVLNDPISGRTGDGDRKKAVVGGLAWDLGKGHSGTLTAQWGDSTESLGEALGDPSTGNGKTTYVDLVMRRQSQNEKLTSWLNATFRYQDLDNVSKGTAVLPVNLKISSVGIAAASRYALSDHCGISARAEWLGTFVSGDKFNQAAVTLTGDYTVMEQLTFRAEVRMDYAKGQTLKGNDLGLYPGSLPDRNGNLDQNFAGTFLAQAVLSF